MTARARTSCFLAAVVVVGACTKRNPAYCEEPAHCPEGVCDLATHTCVESIDAAVVDASDGIPVDAMPPDADTTCLAAGGRIAFSTNRDGDVEIATMYANGTGVVALTTSAFLDSTPRWSPDGSQIAWLSRPTGVDEVFVMNADGSDPINVSRGPGASGTSMSHAWSPDGTMLAFQSDRTGNDDIWIVNADGSDLRNLTANPASDRSPSWAPDGSKLTFSSGRDGNEEVYTVNVDGTGPLRITNDASFDRAPQWSPTGARILFISGRSGRQDLWTVNPTGTGAANITNVAVSDDVLAMSWSPDGSSVAYTVRMFTPNQNVEIWTVSSAGAGAANRSNDTAADTEPRWSPNGDRLLFTSGRTGNSDVFSMLADGGQVANLTNNAATDNNADWVACP
jgi:TolB protein